MLGIFRGQLPTTTGTIAPKFTHGEDCCGASAKNTTMVALLAIGAVATVLATLTLLGYLTIASPIGSFSTTAAIVTLVVGGTITVATIVSLILYNALGRRDDDSYAAPLLDH